MTMTGSKPLQTEDLLKTRYVDKDPKNRLHSACVERNVATYLSNMIPLILLLLR